MSSVEQTSTKGISLKFPPITSVSLAYKSNLVETPLTTITEHVHVQYTGTPIMYRVPVFNVAVDHQQAEITQKAPEPFPVIPTLQETLYKMMSGMTQMENILSQMQENVPVPVPANCYMAKIGIQDAYSITILPEHRKFLKFKLQGKLYILICLSNGLCSSPGKFTKLLKSPLAELRLD